MSEIRDPGLYARLSEPFEDRKEADDALTAFGEDLRVIREKHGIPDVAYVIMAEVLDDQGRAVAGDDDRSRRRRGEAGGDVRIRLRGRHADPRGPDRGPAQAGSKAIEVVP